MDDMDKYWRGQFYNIYVKAFSKAALTKLLFKSGRPEFEWQINFLA